ncbi:hypothetical protein [Neorhizobium sp. JUb45]|uniref:hypothetical protein n=1 Tax=unclassified Neorhizobium TaxID=2629175 RepID=UPI0010536061|nr:hypothetical protein [Neorhizobium sp. JUb45]TCR04803.1 hypothetical protein EDF70_102912 [Neorhizobium sp. JUb45]
MAKAATSRARKTRRSSKAKGGGGMTPWYGAAALVVVGIIAYDNREDLARYLPPTKPPATAASRHEAAKPQPSPRPTSPPAVSSSKAASNLPANVPVPPASIPSRSVPATAPQPIAKPMLASLPPPAIPTAAGAKALAPDGGAKMVGAGFKGQFYYCGRSGLNDCIAEAGVFWHDKTAVRLADVDVPGAESAKCDAERQRGFRAKVRLRELLGAGPFDLVLSDSGDREQAGAKLRVAMRNGKSIGDQLVREGLAQPKGGAFTNWCS